MDISFETSLISKTLMDRTVGFESLVLVKGSLFVFSVCHEKEKVMAYFDRISCAPVLNEARHLMNDLLSMEGLNPQSPTRTGSRAMQILQKAREQVASLITASPGEIIMVSNGTESVNLGLAGLARSAARSRPERKVIVSAIEHTSVMKTARSLEKEGFTVVVVPVDSKGKCDRAAYLSALQEDALVASIQYANPETGTLQDLEFFVNAAHQNNTLFHTDAIAAAGWIPIDVSVLRVDALSLSGTQFGGPPGAAALFIRKGVSLMPVFHGGLQEKHRRAGLENIPAVAGFGVAAEHAVTTMESRAEAALEYAKTLRKNLSQIDDIQFTGDLDSRVPGHVSLLVRYVEGEALLLMLDMKDIQAASGSSCTAKDLKISPVLTALGIEHAEAQGSLVFSTCEQTTMKDVNLVSNELPKIVSRLREMSPLWNQRKTKKE
jgi:cysteine desulfurase